MNTHYNRRQVLTIGLGSLGGLAALGTAGCSTSPIPNHPVRLQMFFWGSSLRNMMTRQTIDLFENNYPTITIDSQFIGFESYLITLNRMVGNDTLPSLIQMDMRYLSEFVRRGLLLDLTPYLSRQMINLTNVDPSLLASSTINKALYGIPLGGNYLSLVYNHNLIEQAGVGTLPHTMTWDDFGIYTAELTRVLGKKGIYGTIDCSGNVITFELWVRQYGNELYTPDGRLGFDEAIVAEWFHYWSKLRKAGSCPPMTVQSGYDITGNPDDSSIITRKAVFGILCSNQYEAWQKATDHALRLMLPPTGALPGIYLKASQLLSISAKTHSPTEAISFSNFIINDPEAVKALGMERGMPGSQTARELLNAQLTPSQQAILEYIEHVSKSSSVRAKHVLDPPGASEIPAHLDRISQAIGFGKLSIQNGAKSFYADAENTLLSHQQ